MTGWMRRHKALTIAITVTVFVLGGLIAFFLMRANHYKKHFFPGTVMSGVDVLELTAQEATDKVARFVSDYMLTLEARDEQRYYIEGPSIGYAYVPNGEIERILAAQNAYDWMQQIKLSKEQEIELSTTFDAAQLEMELAGLPLMQTDQMVAPENAKIEWKDGGYQLIPEVYGTTLRFDEVLEAVTSAVTNGETMLALEEYYVRPEIYQDDEQLVSCMNTIEAYFGTTITYTFGEEDVYELTNEKIQSWLTVDDSYQVHVDDQKVTDFVQQLATTYNTYGDVRTFKTSLGDKIKIGGGDYGWVINKEQEKSQIYEDLSNGGKIEREPVYSQTAKKHGVKDIGSTYVEIDYTNQHMWYYKKGELVVETDIVSGNLNRSNGSPDGVFKIVYKQRDATLVGEGYSSPVKYFMPFAYNVGIHDASWRSRFGDRIYMSSGSHGCINVPSDVAETIFNTIEVGTPVIAYYREQVYLTAENARISNAYSYINEDEYKEIMRKKASVKKQTIKKEEQKADSKKEAKKKTKKQETKPAEEEE